ncbi:hypothetical protein SAZ11_52955 [Streptomyces sp. FXJ1.4098]|nr:hypothetical protein [Streptomyces sp. FXJ1.4098]
MPDATDGAAPPTTSTRPRAQVTEAERVLAVAAETPERLAAWLAEEDDAALRATATVPASGRVRLGIVGPTAKRLALARRVVAKKASWRGRNDVWFTPDPLLSERAAGKPGRVVFVFPGLEAEFAPRVDGVAEYFGLSPATVGAADGRAPVGDIGRHGVGVFAVGRLLDRAMRRMGVVPDAVAGTASANGPRWCRPGCTPAPRSTNSSARSTPTRCACPGWRSAYWAPPPSGCWPRSRRARTVGSYSPTTTRRTSRWCAGRGPTSRRSYGSCVPRG